MQIEIDLAAEIFQLKQELLEIRKILSWAVANEQKMLNIKQKNQNLYLQIQKAEKKWKSHQG